ncbi:MAG: thiolase C-terminal domain-containing protein [Candidatus Helarchaeota archaeon]
MGKLARDVAIIGAGISKFGVRTDKNLPDLWIEAYLDAVKSVDNGISVNDIDGGLYLGNFTADLFNGQGHLGPMMADLIGLTPKGATRFEGACASSGLAFRHAVLAVASGVADVVCVGGIEKMTTLPTAGVTEALAAASDAIYEARVGATFPGLYANIASAHFHKYGTKSEDLFNVAIKNHENGKLNDKAQMPYSIEDIRQQKIEKIKKKGGEAPDWKDDFDFLRSSSNPVIAYPLRLFDCSLITDGAACVFLAAANIAKKFTDTPILVAGTGQGSASLSLHDRKGEYTSFISARTAAEQAYKMANVRPKDIKIAEVHDCFTIAELVAMEDLGFAKPGDAARMVREGETGLDGTIPINTDGGLKAKGHPVGATGVGQVVEVYKQLKGIAKKRQIKNDPEIGLTHNLGGSGGTCVVHVFKRM